MHFQMDITLLLLISHSEEMCKFYLISFRKLWHTKGNKMHKSNKLFMYLELLKHDGFK